MEKIYRRDYQGEFVVFNTNKVKGMVQEHREWVPNTINEAHSGNAMVFGNGPSRANIHWQLFKLHKGGLHGSKKLTTYGCNAMFRDCDPHILVVKHPLIADEIAKTDYADNNIVITHTKNILKHEDKFHMIPFDPVLCAGATALYLAAFDGHAKVYFMGFDGYDHNINNNIYANTNGYGTDKSEVNAQKQIDDVMKVFNTYDTTEFIRVTENGTEYMPEEWKYAKNLRCIDFRTFVSEVDLGAT
jgi:hypothetical protein